MRSRGIERRVCGRPVAFVALALVAVALAACGGQTSATSGEIEIASGPLAGKIGGVAWALGSAESDAYLSGLSDKLWVAAYAETVTPCTGAGSSLNGNHLLLNVPKVPGDYRLGLQFTQTFYVQSTNFNYGATQGRMVVDTVTATTVTGGAHFQFDANNVVDGQFEVTICP
jgi:hypothetical protein